MKYLFTFLFCFFIFISLHSQQLISGFIKDTSGYPVYQANIWQGHITNSHFSDVHGAFHIVINERSKKIIHIEHPHFQQLQIAQLDTISGQLDIVLHEIPIGADSLNIFVRDRRYVRRGGQIGFGLDVYDPDYGAFENLLGSGNTSVLNRVNGVAAFELGFTRKRRYFGLIWGIIFTDGLDKEEGDSLNIEMVNNLFGFNLGYRVINNRTLYFMPHFTLKWYRSRLINTNKEAEIPIDQYLNERDLDIRFNQPAATIGGTLAFKFKGKRNNTPGHYLTLGLYGAYLFKLRDKPWINARRLSLEHDRKIDFKNYNFGVFASMNFDPR